MGHDPRTMVRSPIAPRLESDLMRDASLGFEAQAECGFIRCIEHGFPTPLARWHYHDEFELQLIVATHGRAFVGDYIGNFEPGHLVLTGPRLPHNWISTNAPASGAGVSRLVIQFRDAPLRRGMDAFPELGDLGPLLDRSRHGIEFFGVSALAQRQFQRIRHSSGLRRFIEFAALLCDLSSCTEYRLLSTVQIESRDDDPSMERLNKVIEYVGERYGESIEMNEIYALTGMSQSTFSRHFSRATGSTFTDFVNRYRVSKACELLMHTDHYIAKIGFDVGFNNLANFNRRFAEVKGMTPSEFRRQGALRFGSSSARALAA